MSWKCTLCEFQNSQFLPKCEMCDSPKNAFQANKQQMSNPKNAANDSNKADWTCEQCNAQNEQNHLFCVMCGYRKGYDAMNDPKNKAKVPKQAPSNEHKTEAKQEPFVSMADYRNEQKINQNALSNVNIIHKNDYKIGDEILYPNTYTELAKNVLLFKEYPRAIDNPSKYSLGCVLSMDSANNTVIMTDILLNNNAHICVNTALIQKFEMSQYAAFKRGVSISFYDKARQDWNEGRIESVIDKTVGIQYSNDEWTMVPIFYVRKYEELKEDEWSNVSDFVFKEYVRDIASELAKKSINESKTVIDPDQFRAAMQKLGINSITSRTKAFAIFERMKNEIMSQSRIEQKEQSESESNVLQTHMRLLRDTGHIVGQTYKCVGQCQAEQCSIDGIYLTNCKDTICLIDFGLVLDSVVQKRSQRLLKCGACAAEINPIDIERHGTPFQHSIITQMQLDTVINYTFDAAVCHKCKGKNDILDGLVQYVCMHCGGDNCLHCKAMHSSAVTCEEFEFGNHKFRQEWTHNHKSDARKGAAVLMRVTQNSKEWNEIVANMKYSPNKVVKIERIEHSDLWQKYYKYSQSLGTRLSEVSVWHGTRRTNPCLIYNSGFLKEKSRVGGCLWYAVHSSYSMNGFQHPIGDGQSQLFLCFVAGGDNNDVKYIRNNKILNVYRNEATYPAYLVTYVQ